MKDHEIHGPNSSNETEKHKFDGMDYYVH